jgi:hypothetical protein
MTGPDTNELDWLNTVVRRLKRGEANAVIAETRAALNQQPDRIEYLLTLALAYSWLGAGNESEPYAHQALNEINRRGLAEKGAYWFPRYRDMGYQAVFDATMLQGAFKEAADLLAGYAPSAIHTNIMWTCAAFGYFLAGDNGNAAIALRNRIPNDPDTRRAITPPNNTNYLTSTI